MKKILSLLSTIIFTTITSTNVIACSYRENNLNIIIENKNLGNIYVGQLLSKPNKTQILSAIKNKNPKASVLTINDFDIQGSPTAEYVVIIGISGYKGEIGLNYKAQEFKKVTGWDKNNGKILHLSVIFDGTIYAITDKALYRSNTDGSFEKITAWNEETNGTILSFLITANITIYVGSTFGLYKLSNFSFKMVSGIEYSKNFCALVEFKGTIYAAAYNLDSETHGALYRSKTDDSFENMIKASEGIYEIISLVTTNDTIYIGTNSPTTNYSLLKLDDNWTPISVKSWDTAIMGCPINLVNFNGTIYATSSNKGKLYKISTTNNDSVEEITSWNEEGAILHLIFTTDERIYYVATDKNMLYRSKIDGSFVKVTGWDENKGNVLSLFNINRTIYVGTDKGILYESDKITADLYSILHKNI